MHIWNTFGLSQPSEQQFLVLHNQFVGAHIVRRCFLLVGDFAVGHFALAVHGEISRVCLACVNAAQVFFIFFLAYAELPLAENILVFFLEHLGVSAVDRLSGFIVLAVFRHLVNKEQAEYLDSSAEKLTFALDMGQNRFAYLNAAKLIFVQPADHISGTDSDAVEEFHRTVAPVNLFNDKALLVFLQFIGIHIEIVADFANTALFLGRAVCHLDLKLQCRCRITGGKIDAFQINVAVGGGAAGFGNAFDGDLLDKPFVVGFHRVKAVDHVVNAVGFMGSGIAQRQQRTEFPQPRFGLLALDRLWLVDNQHRIGLGNHVDGTAGTEFVEPHIDSSRVLAFGVERLRIDNHNADSTVRRKVVNFGKLRGIVDECGDFLAVFLGEMLLRHHEGFIDAFTDCHARHNHNEFRPAVMLVQFKNGFDIGIGLADAGFHFDGEIVAPAGHFQFIGRLQAIGTLNVLQLFENLFIGQFGNNRGIAPAGEFHIPERSLRGLISTVNQIRIGHIRLSRKHIDNRLCRVRLELLIFILDLQDCSSPLSSSIHCFSLACNNCLSGRYNSYLEA